jgi:hypothetical protein
MDLSKIKSTETAPQHGCAQYVAVAANICGSADMPSSWLENFELGQISLNQPMAEILVNSSIFLSLREEMAMVIGNVCAAYRWASQSEIPWPAR